MTVEADNAALAELHLARFLEAEEAGEGAERYWALAGVHELLGETNEAQHWRYVAQQVAEVVGV